MNLTLNKNLATNYKNPAQKIRVQSESWVSENIFCPSCGKQIYKHQNNKPVADFYCDKCSQDFELKSKKGKFANKIPAGNFQTFINRISSKNKPNFFFMAYLESLSIDDFFVIPKHFFAASVIEKRNPLKQTARRAGWIGSYMLFSKIPQAGHIYYVKDNVEIPKKEILMKWQKTLFLKDIKKEDFKGWILDIINCIEALNKKEFSLVDIYQFKNGLKKLHPENKNIEAKIRQQMQFLRNKGYIEFINHGLYRLK
jgi:type II restriction enzyme